MRWVLLLSILLATSVNAGETTVIEERALGFQSCLKYIQGVASNLGVAPINIVETSEMRMVRFKTNDGSGNSFLVTCSKPDRKLIISLTTR